MNWDACVPFKTTMITSADALELVNSIVADFGYVAWIDWIDDDTNYHIVVDTDNDIMKEMKMVNAMENNGFRVLCSDTERYWFD